MKNDPAFRSDLIRKYNRPGPRYTSYPTAPHFQDISHPAPLLQAMRESGDANPALSLYVHLPFCESACWFCGCTKIITRNHDAANAYLDLLEQETALIRPQLSPAARITQLHWGGGTPTFLNASQIRRLGTHLRARFDFSPDCECSVEIDPRSFTPEQVEALREVGFSRASLGVQDHNPEVQKAVHRIQPRELTGQSITWLREADFRSINIDLIYGLPQQTVESFARTLEEVLTLRPDRLALFSYAHVPWIKPAQKIFDTRGSLPDDETKLAILEDAVGRLAAHGYLHIGMDHFALGHDELAQARRSGTLQRNFQGYSTGAGTDICGIGLSSISQTARSYRQNFKEMNLYAEAVQAGRLPLSKGYHLSDDDWIRRETIMRLMCDLQLSFPALSADLGIDFAQYFQSELQSLTAMAADGLLTLDDTSLRVTPTGRYLLRNIAMAFDAYLSKAAARHSKTV